MKAGKADLGLTELVGLREGLGRTFAWGRSDPAGPAQGIGLLGEDADDTLLGEIDSPPR